MAQFLLNNQRESMEKLMSIQNDITGASLVTLKAFWDINFGKKYYDPQTKLDFDGYCYFDTYEKSFQFDKSVNRSDLSLLYNHTSFIASSLYRDMPVPVKNYRKSVLDISGYHNNSINLSVSLAREQSYSAEFDYIQDIVKEFDKHTQKYVCMAAQYHKMKVNTGTLYATSAKIVEGIAKSEIICDYWDVAKVCVIEWAELSRKVRKEVIDKAQQQYVIPAIMKDSLINDVRMVICTMEDESVQYCAGIEDFYIPLKHLRKNPLAVEQLMKVIANTVLKDRVKLMTRIRKFWQAPMDRFQLQSEMGQFKEITAAISKMFHFTL